MKPEMTEKAVSPKLAKKRGPKHYMDKADLKSQMIVLRVTRAEKKSLKAQAKQAGHPTISKYLRSLMIPVVK